MSKTTARLKVYGWTGSRNEARTDGNFHGQTREIVAARSAAEVKRLTGMTRTEWEHVGCETGREPLQEVIGEPAAPYQAIGRHMRHRPVNYRIDIRHPADDTQRILKVIGAKENPCQIDEIER